MDKPSVGAEVACMTDERLAAIEADIAKVDAWLLDGTLSPLAWYTEMQLSRSQLLAEVRRLRARTAGCSIRLLALEAVAEAARALVGGACTGSREEPPTVHGPDLAALEAALACLDKAKKTNAEPERAASGIEDFVLAVARAIGLDHEPPGSVEELLEECRRLRAQPAAFLPCHECNGGVVVAACTRCGEQYMTVEESAAVEAQRNAKCK